jgi:hypothetical protein
MRKSRFSEEQIIGMIKEQEGGLGTAEVRRKSPFEKGGLPVFRLEGKP